LIYLMKNKQRIYISKVKEKQIIKPLNKNSKLKGNSGIIPHLNLNGTGVVIPSNEGTSLLRTRRGEHIPFIEVTTDLRRLR
jgi:tRNA A58 N-methylase Trm61